MAVAELGNLVRRINPLADSHSIDAHLRILFEGCAKKLGREKDKETLFTHDI